MAHLYPTEPEFADDRRAERTVWEALRDQLPDDAALFHSVGLIENEKVDGFLAAIFGKSEGALVAG